MKVGDLVSYIGMRSVRSKVIPPRTAIVVSMDFFEGATLEYPGILTLATHENAAVGEIAIMKGLANEWVVVDENR